MKRGGWIVIGLVVLGLGVVLLRSLQDDAGRGEGTGAANVVGPGDSDPRTARTPDDELSIPRVSDTEDGAPDAGRSAVEPIEEPVDPAPIEAPELDPEWLQCAMAGSPQGVRQCVGQYVPAGGFSPEELAAVVCTDTDFPSVERYLLMESVARWNPDRAPAELGRFQELCGDKNFWWMEFLGSIRRDRPDWSYRFAEAIEPTDLFNSRSDIALVDIAMNLAQSEAPQLKKLLEAGARGEHGGSAPQVARATLGALRMQGTDRTRMDFIRTVLASENQLGGPEQGRTLVQWTLNPRMIRQGRVNEVIEVLDLLLGTKGLARGAAQQIADQKLLRLLEKEAAPEELDRLSARLAELGQ